MLILPKTGYNRNKENLRFSEKIMKISFGRVNIPHPGHKYLIDKCDTFILSNGIKNQSGESRIKILNRLGISSSKLIVGNPFREISRIVDNNSNVEIYYTEDNYSLVKSFQDKAKLVKIEKVGGISSTKIRQLFKEGKTGEIKSIFSNDIELYKMVKEQYETEKSK